MPKSLSNRVIKYLEKPISRRKREHAEIKNILLAKIDKEIKASYFFKGIFEMLIGKLLINDKKTCI